ncbi:uncharacterized protein LOC100198758 isoform X1 [Hydra vulgaris]|uniref:uncharacterized protein LOC100198758 isoform X1 n=1 Tax=Hydra vulgaris TaxID=6087 RepID=UPI001F5EEEB5|nr:uncharacterized protein LOC100198758 isoform X1 [Hydra vulgaris]
MLTFFVWLVFVSIKLVDGYICDLQPGISKCDVQGVSECDLQRRVSVIIDSTAEISNKDFDIQIEIVKLLFPKFNIGRLLFSAQVYYDKCSELPSAYEEGFYKIKTDFQSRISLLQYRKSDAKFNLNCSLQIYENIENLLPVSSSENFGIILTKHVKIPESAIYDGIYYTALLYKSPREPFLRQISKKSSDIPVLITELMDSICPKTTTDLIKIIFSTTALKQEFSELELAKSTINLKAESLLRHYDTLTSTFKENKHSEATLILKSSFEKRITYSINTHSVSEFNSTEIFLLNSLFPNFSSYLQPGSTILDRPLLTTMLDSSLLNSVYEKKPINKTNNQELFETIKDLYQTIFKSSTIIRFKQILATSLYPSNSKNMESKNQTDLFSLNTDFQRYNKLVTQTMYKQTVDTSEMITNEDSSTMVFEVDSHIDLSSFQMYASTYSLMFTSTLNQIYKSSFSYSPSFSQIFTKHSYIQNTDNIETPLFTNSKILMNTDSPQIIFSQMYTEYFGTKNTDNKKTPLLTSFSFFSSSFVSSNVLSSSFSQTYTIFSDDKNIESSKTVLFTSFLMYSSVLLNSETTPKIQSTTEWLQISPINYVSKLEKSSIQSINSFSLPITSTINPSFSTKKYAFSQDFSTRRNQSYINKLFTTKSTINLTVSSSAMLENIVWKNVFIKKINDFIERKATILQLQDQDWIHEFVKNASTILTDVGNFNNTEIINESNELIEYIEDVLMSIGTNFPIGSNLTYETNEIAFEISLVKPALFAGYIFKRKNETLQLPYDLFHNLSADKIVIVAMTYKRLPSMISKRENIWYNEQVISISTSALIQTPFKTPLFYKLQIEGEKWTDFLCVYWNKSDWSSNGCELSQINHTLVSCQCNHMTSFSILLQIKSHEVSKTNQFILSMITYIGCGASIIGCLSLILIYLMCGRLAIIDRNIVHINLAIAITLSNSLFLTADSVFKYKSICLAVSLALLYSFLATFFWMLVEGIHVYLMVVIVFKSTRRLTVYMIIGWVLPALIVALAGVKFHKQLVRQDFCWLSTENHMIWFFAAPSLLIMIINSVILTSTLKASLKMTVEPGEFKRLRKMARLTLLLMPIFGLTWVFGLLAINQQTIIFQYIFTATNSFQGLFIFICYCLLNNEVKREYVQVKQRSINYLSSKSTGTTDVGFSSNIHPHQRWRFKDALSISDSTSVKLTKFKSIQSTPYYQECKDTDIPESITEALYKKSKNYSIELLKLSQNDDRVSVDSNDPILSPNTCKTVGSLQNEPLEINNKSMRQKTFYSVMKAYQF